MKKFTITCLSILSLTIGCDKKEKNESSTEVVPDSTEVVVNDHHNAKNSWDYIGVYKGILPCADCEGIETTLYLTDENKYVLETKYLGKKNSKTNELKGTYSWNETGNTVILASIENGPSHYFVGENYLTQLDMEGNKITGDLATKYILQKQTTADSMQSSPVKEAKQVNSSKVATYSILDVKWKLVELNGIPIEKATNSTKEMFLQLVKEKRYAAYAGCNNIMGGFELKENALRIKFTKGASTMMACPDMETEQEFAKMLETVDNYSINGNKMTLNKARMAPLARFEVMK